MNYLVRILLQIESAECVLKQKIRIKMTTVLWQCHRKTVLLGSLYLHEST